MSELNISKQNFAVSKELIDAQMRNVSGAINPHYTEIDPVVRTGPYSVSVDLISRVDKSEFRRIHSSCAQASAAEVMHETAQDFQRILGGNDPTESKLVTELNELLVQANGLVNSNDIPSRKNFILKGQRFATEINDTINGIKNLRNRANNDVQQGIDKVNSILKDLFEVNQAILSSSTAGDSGVGYHAERNRLLSELSEHMDIKITLAGKGEVYVATQKGGIELLSTSSYGKLYQEGIFTQNPDSDKNAEDLPIFLEMIDETGRSKSKLQLFGGDITNPTLTGGSIGANLELRDQTLANSLNVTRHFRDQIFAKINYVHNKASSYPASTNLQSAEKFRENESTNFSGAMSIFSLDENGRQLIGEGGPLHEQKIDFDNLISRSHGGKPTMREIINEFNFIMDTKPSSNRVAMGEVAVDSASGSAANSQKEYLLNSINIVGTSDIVNNNMSFDFELDGNAYFSSEIEITEINLNGNSIEQNKLPNIIHLDRNSSMKSGNKISIDNLSPSAVNIINVKVLIKGENGVIREGSVSFEVDTTDTYALNKRYFPSQNIGNEPDGDFKTLLPSHSGVARAMLVDDSGNEVLPGDNTPGHFVIKTHSDDYRISLSGSDFANKLGLNNLFNTLEDTSFVRSDIVNDPNKLALGQVTVNDDKRISAMVAANKASLSMRFINNLQNGDVITINNQSLTIGAGPGEINLGTDIYETIYNIKEYINNHPELSRIIHAHSVGGDSLKLEAITGGVWGNEIRANVNLSAANIALGNAPPQAVMTNYFGGGSMKFEGITVRSYSIGQNSTELAEELVNLRQAINSFDELKRDDKTLIAKFTGNIADFLTVNINFFDNIVRDARSSFKAHTEFYANILTQFRKKNSPTQEEAYLKAVNDMSLLTTAAQVHSMLVTNHRKVQDILFAA